MENTACEMKSGGTADITLLVRTHPDLLVSKLQIHSAEGKS